MKVRKKSNEEIMKDARYCNGYSMVFAIGAVASWIITIFLMYLGKGDAWIGFIASVLFAMFSILFMQSEENEIIKLEIRDAKEEIKEEIQVLEIVLSGE